MPDIVLDFEIPTDFASVTDEQLVELQAQITRAAQPLLEAQRADAFALSEGDVSTLERLSEAVQAVAAERGRRLTATAATEQGDRRADRATDAAAAFTQQTPPETPTPPPSVADVAANSGVVTPPADVAAPRVSRLMAAANIDRMPHGTEYTDIEHVARVAEQQMAAFSGSGDGQFIKRPVMFLQREWPEDLRIDVEQGDKVLQVLDHAADERRLEGGSLLAAAGWCAPSEIDYGLFEIETDDGMIDVPEVQINRGGINFTVGPDFSTIFGGAGYFLRTEAQVIAGTPVKPTMVISCPSFTDVRLQVQGAQVTGAFLQDRGYPEMVARFIRGTLKAHAHNINIFKINQIIAGSTLFDYTNAANMAVTTTEFKDLTTISRMLAIVGTQIMDYRYKHRMARNATLDVILPYWLIESVRGDVQRRTGTSAAEAFAIAESMINEWFSIRGARCQWIYDWLDAYNTTNTSTVGQSAGVYTLPTTVEAVIFAAGTWVAGRADVVRLDTVYDSTNLQTNQYIKLFTEEGILMAKRGFESRRIKTTIDPSGTLSATTVMTTG